jgi:hypothetical protein
MTYHMHRSGHRTYNQSDVVRGNYLHVEPCFL